MYELFEVVVEVVVGHDLVAVVVAESVWNSAEQVVSIPLLNPLVEYNNHPSLF